jgi:hypothetical protein
MTWLAVAWLIAACGDGSVGGDDDGTGDGGMGDGGPGGADAACVGLECFQVANCPGGGTTSLSGTVYAPNGTLPLYNVTVYVPNGTVEAFVPGVACDRCADLSGSPLVETTTDTHGNFSLPDMPATQNVPLVLQIGRWRRQIVLPDVPACADTPLTVDQTRLPRNQGEGDIPLMALTTGGADALECLLRKVGLDDGEFTTQGGSGRVHLYAGQEGTDRFAPALGGAAFAGAQELWNQDSTLAPYNVVFLSCEGDQNPGTKSAAARQALYDYTNLGGRVFASHWHNYWIQAGPDPWPQTLTFNFQSDLNDITADVDTSYPRGMDLADWLVNVGAALTLGKIDLTATQHTVTAVNAALAQRMIYLDTTANGTPSIQYMTFTTPLTVLEDQRCGRVVFSDIHVSSGDESSPSQAFPDGCTSMGLSPQEKVLAFMIFDIAACIGPPIP